MILQEKAKDVKIILASQSPRRQVLMKELGLNFEVRVNHDDDESYPRNLTYSEIPVFLAKKKALPFIKSLQKDEILITSDTIVWCNNRVLGKPANREEAVKILIELSGNKHVVITGVCLSAIGRSHAFNALTSVYFRELHMEEIEFYVDRYKPFDKAGAYGIQEWIGHVGIERIDGSFFNVMGLPVQKLYMELMNFIK